VLAPLQDSLHQEADQAFGRLMEESPRDPRAYVARGLVRQRAGDIMGADQLYRAAQRVAPAFGPAYVNHGAMLLEAGKHAAAVDVLSRGAAHLPDQAPIFANLAAGLANLGRYEEAVASAETSVELDGRDPDLRRNLAAILARAGRLEESQQVLKSCMADFPEEAPDILLRLSELHVARDDEDRALEVLERLNRLDPSLPLPWLRRAALLARRDDMDGCTAVLAEALVHLPDNQEVRDFFRASMAMRLQRDLDDGTERIKRDRHDVEAYLKVARIHELGRDLEAALEVLTQGIEDNPESPRLWSQVGLVELGRSREREALAAWRRAIQLDKRQALALNNCAYLLVTAKDPSLHDVEEALRLVRRAVALEPKNTAYLDTLAEVHFARGDTRSAQRAIAEALRLEPGDAWLQSQSRRFEDAGSSRPGRGARAAPLPSPPPATP
jgi:tetratricopeptide (TPR) repeat protein